MLSDKACFRPLLIFIYVLSLSPGCSGIVEKVENTLSRTQKKMGALADKAREKADNAGDRVTDAFLVTDFDPATVLVSFQLGIDPLPHSVAILPLANHTGDKEATLVLRRMFFSAISYHGYSPQQIEKTDLLLFEKNKITRADQLSGISPPELAKSIQVDGLFYGEINTYKNIFTGVVNRAVITARFWLISTATGKVIWEVENTARRQNLNAALGANIRETVVKTAEAVLAGGVSQWLRLSLLEEAVNDLVVTISATLPNPRQNMKGFKNLPSPLIVNLEAALSGDTSFVALIAPGDVILNGTVLPKFTIILPGTALPEKFPVYTEYILPQNLAIPDGLAIISENVLLDDDVMMPKGREGGLLLSPGYRSTGNWRIHQGFRATR